MILRFVIYFVAKFEPRLFKEEEEKDPTDTVLINSMLTVFAVLEVIIVASIIFVQFKTIVDDNKDLEQEDLTVRSSMLLR